MLHHSIPSSVLVEIDVTFFTPLFCSFTPCPAPPPLSTLPPLFPCHVCLHGFCLQKSCRMWLCLYLHFSYICYSIPLLLKHLALDLTHVPIPYFPPISFSTHGFWLSVPMQSALFWLFFTFFSRVSLVATSTLIITQLSLASSVLE